MTEFLERELGGAGISFNPSGNSLVTYHDPCRLGRMTGNYDLPRELLKKIPELELVEMQRNRENALCCGTSAWMECTVCSKATRIERLEEALGTGAQTLITACPKCQIHLTCALGSSELELNIKDLYSYLLEQMGGNE